jgi:predicted RNase H-like HicB family nuclease
MEYTVQAWWDPEASVWVAESEDVPGLVTEAETLDALHSKLLVLVPELLEANEVVLPPNDGELPFSLTTHSSVARRAV